MRFRGKISREGVGLVVTTLQTIGKISHDAAILLEPDTFRLTGIHDAIDAAKIFVELHTEILFEEYRIDSQSENKIALEVNISMMIQALSPHKNANHIVIKLAKRDQKPCLNITLDSQDSLFNMNVCHDIPIKLIKVQEQLHAMLPPMVSPPTVSLILPHNKTLKTLIERMGKFSRLITIDAFQDGRLQLKVEGSNVQIQSMFTAVKPRPLPDQSIEETRHNRLSTCVHLKKLAAIMDYHAILYSEASIFFSKNEAIVLYIDLEPAAVGSLTCYLPVLVEDD